MHCSSSGSEALTLSSGRQINSSSSAHRGPVIWPASKQSATQPKHLSKRDQASPPILHYMDMEAAVRRQPSLCTELVWTSTRERGRATAQQSFSVHSYCVSSLASSTPSPEVVCRKQQSQLHHGGTTASVAPSPMDLLKVGKLSVFSDTSSVSLTEIVIPDFV